MKHFAIITFVLVVGFHSFAQVNSEDFDLVQTVYGMEKREIFQEFLGEDVNKDFWELYKTYEAKRNELGKKRFELLKAYSQDYVDMDDTKSSQILKNAFKLNMDFNSLITSYTKKIEKGYGGTIAMQFYQLEHYFLGLTRTELIENIPVITEMLRED